MTLSARRSWLSMSCFSPAVSMPVSIERIWNCGLSRILVSWMTLVAQPDGGELLADVADGRRLVEGDPDEGPRAEVDAQLQAAAEGDVDDAGQDDDGRDDQGDVLVLHELDLGGCLEDLHGQMLSFLMLRRFVTVRSKMRCETKTAVNRLATRAMIRVTA